MKDWEKQYQKYQREILTKAGFDFVKLTQNQVDIIMEPSEAPENYLCDGEITSEQAYYNWKKNLKESGLTRAQVRTAIMLNFGRR